MRAFHLAYPDEALFVTQPVSQIPWGHTIALLQELKDQTERLWYAAHTMEHGWSRATLVHQIETGLYRRSGQALPALQSTLPTIATPEAELQQGELQQGELQQGDAPEGDG